jgi:PPM family protein phosphatase
MGTTLVAALVSGKLATVGSAGDSRCYLFREGKLTQLTRDDSWVSAAWAEGILTHDEIDRHPLRNVITKAVGAKEEIDLETVEHQLVKGDILLLCSDGLHSMLNDQSILQAVTPFPAALPEAAQKLIDAANEAGGKDNVSVVLLRYSE